MAQHGQAPRSGVVTALLMAIALLLVVGCGFSGQLPRGRHEVRQLQEDPVLGFRAPGTEFRGQEAQPAKRGSFGEGTTTSWLRQQFELTAEPGPTLDAYRRQAEAGGWTFIVDGCARTARATATVLGKTFDRFEATLSVLAEVTDGNPTGRLTVSLEATAANVQSLPVDAGLRRNDVDCLRGLDPSDPDLRVPDGGGEAVRQLCARIPLARARRIAAQIEASELQDVGRGECWVNGARTVNGARIPVFVIEPASQPRAHYLDRRVPSEQGSDQVFLFSVDGKKDPDLVRSVWLMTTKGPFVVRAGGALTLGKESDPLLFRMANLVSDVAGQP